MFKLTGTRKMQQALARVTDGMKVSERQAADAEAEGILASAKPNVPVQTGKLRDSGEAETKVSATGVEAEMSFGGQGVEYAVPVHERPGKGHKYLERPFRDAEAGMAGRIARRVKP